MKRSHAHVRIGIVLLAAALACIPTPDVTLTPLGAERTYPATPETVPIPLYTITKPECPYDEIAALAAEGYFSDAVLLSALRKSARAVGGQAIIAFTQSTRSSGTGTGVSVRTGTAIRFRSGDCVK